MRNLISFIAIAIFTLALAQEQSHSVSVALPSILMLELGTNSSLKDVPLNIEVNKDSYVINPGQSTLRVLANQNWALSAKYQASSKQDETVKLMFNAGSDWHAFGQFDKVVARGQKAAGWQNIVVDYKLDTPLPPEGNYQGVITYTLTKP